MANYYYVKNGGTGSGDGGRYTSQQTTSPWATEFPTTAEYYDDLTSALGATTAPVAGDFIVFSHLHTKTAAGALSHSGPTGGAFLLCVSVDDAAITVAKAGAQDNTGTGVHDLTLTGNFYFHGVNIDIGDDLLLGSNNHIIITNANIKVLTGSTPDISLLSGSSLTFIDTDVEFVAANGKVVMSDDSVFSAIGGSIFRTGGLTTLVDGVVGGIKVELLGVDISTIGSGGYIVSNVGASQSGDDVVDVKIEECKVHASLTDFVEEAFSSPTMGCEVIRSSGASATAEHQYFKRLWAGDAEDQDDSGIHRDETIAFTDSGTKISIKVVTNTNASKSNPFILDLPARWAALSAAATDNIRVYFAITNATTLHDDDVWAEVIYPDGTNKHQFNTISNCPGESGTFICDLIKTSTTAHTDDSGSSTWKNGASDLTAHNEYRMDIDTSSDVGTDSVPIIRIHIAIPSVTVYFDPTVDLVAP